MSELTYHHQAGKPPHWRLQEEVDLPNGRRLTGSKARVYEVLRLAQDTAHCFRVGKAMAPAGWVPVWVFREPWAGGSAGDRRLRDLRQLGVRLEGRPFDSCDGSSASSSWIWRLSPSGGTAPLEGEPIARKKPSGREARVSAPLTGLTILLRLERPALWAGELLDLSPGMPHIAAPTASLALRVTEGRLNPAEAQAVYREQLLATYRTGDLIRAFNAGTTTTICCEAPFDALGVLGKALAKLGAAVETVA